MKPVMNGTWTKQKPVFSGKPYSLKDLVDLVYEMLYKYFA
jgi:hypothetical protein